MPCGFGAGLLFICTEMTIRYNLALSLPLR